MQTISRFVHDERAWMDFVLSKTALILASVVVIAALYHFAVSMAELNSQKELDLLSTELVSYIDKVGSSPSEKSLVYSFNGEKLPFFRGQQVQALISGEYLIINAKVDGKQIISAKTPAFRIFPYPPSTLHNELESRYGSNGTIAEPVMTGHSDIIDYLTLRTKEVSLNTSKQVNIQKTFVYTTDGTKVEKVGYVLVYQ